MMNQTLESNLALDRRSLLKLLSASPLLWGASNLLGTSREPQNPVQGKRPAWFLAALRQARTRQAPVVAVVVPDVTKKEIQTKALKKQKAAFKKRLQALYNGQAKTEPPRNGKQPLCGADAWFTIRFEDRLSRLAVYLQLLLDSQDPAMQELLLEAVWVCAPASLLGTEASETVVTLDSKDRRTGGTILDLSNEAEVTHKLDHLLHGNGKLRKRAKIARTPEVAAALRDLASDSRTKRSKAKDVLLQDLPEKIPAIIEARHHQGDGAVRRALGEIIAMAHERARKQGYRGVLPFGTQLQQRSIYDPCPPCGMSKVPAGTAKMLKLLGK